VRGAGLGSGNGRRLAAVLLTLAAVAGLGATLAMAAARSRARTHGSVSSIHRSVSSPTVALSSTAAGASVVTYTVGFSTSAGGAIPAGGTITLVGPPGTLWPIHNACAYVLTDATTPSGSFSCAQAVSSGEFGLPVYAFNGLSGAAVTIKVPNAINAGDSVSLSVSGVANPGAGSYHLAVSTSADQAPAAVAYAITASGSVSSPAVALSSGAAGASAVTYTVGFSTSATGAIPAGGTITLDGAPGTLWPVHDGCAYVLTDATTPSGSFSCASGVSVSQPGLPVYSFNGYSGAAVTITVPNAIKAGDSVTLAVSGAANPGAGSDHLSVWTSADSHPASVSYTTTTTQSLSSPSVAVSSTTAGATGVTYTVAGFTTSSSGAIPTGGTITLVATAGTILPSSSCDYALTDATTPSASFTCATSASVSGNGSSVTLVVPSPIKAGDSLTLGITGVTNPGSGSYSLHLATSADGAPATSSPYSITGSPASLTAVSSPSLSVSSSAGGANGVTYTVRFTTSPSGALTGGSGMISLAAPAGTVFGACPYGCGGGNATYTIDDLTTSSGSGPATPITWTDNGEIVGIEPQNTIAAGDTVVLTITQVTNPPAGNGQLTLATSSDKRPVSVTDNTTAPGTVTSPSLAMSSSSGSANGVSYTVRFTTSASGEILGGFGSISLAAPEGTVFGACPYGCGGGNATYTIDDLTTPSGSGSATVSSWSDNGAMVDIQPQNTIAAGDTVVLTITQVTNPPGGSGQLTLATSSDKRPVTVSEDTTATSSVADPALAVSSTTPGAANVTYTVGFDTSSTGELLGGLSAIALAAPSGTGFPSSGPSAPTITDETHPSGSGTVPYITTVDGGSVVDLVVPNTIAAGDTIVISFPGVNNPTADIGAVQVSTSSDPARAPVAVATDVTATAANASAKVSWVAPTATPSGDPIQGYLVTPYVGTTPGPPDMVGPSATATTVGGLTNGTAYTFTVTAIMTVSSAAAYGPASAPSNPVTPTTGPGGTPPAVAFTTQVLNFGAVGVGKTSAEQTVGISNAGSQTLQVSSVGLSGADRGEFTIDSDSCAGASIAGGQGCAVTLRFKAAGAGTATAQLVLADNAAGSPQTVGLTAIGTELGTISGTVDDASKAGNPPVAGAGLEICPQAGSGIIAACQFEYSGLNGGYSFGGLAPGRWLLQASPPSSSLFGASAIVQVTPGTQIQNFRLSAPVPLPPGITVIGGAGGSGGVPTLVWNQPFALQYAPKFPSEPAGTEIAYITSVGLFNAGSGSSTAITSGALVLIVDYAGGTPTVVGQYPDPGGGADPSVTVSSDAATAAQATSAGGSDEIEMESLPDGNTIQANVPSVQERTHGATQITVRRSYVVLSGPAAGSSSGAAAHARRLHRTLAALPAGAQATASKCVVPALAGRTLAAARTALAQAGCAAGTIRQARSNKVPVGHVIASLPKAGTVRKTGAKVTLLISLGPTTPKKRKPKPRKVKVRFKGRRIYIGAAKSPKGPKIVVHIPPDPDGGDAYYDPSGLIESTHGIPLARAKVTLLRSTLRQGPFVRVPDGSLIMSPSNRRDPDFTGALGRFGWDVLPGFYRVSAERTGCRAVSGARLAKSPVHEVPPPVANLVLKLRCPRLRRARSHLRLRVRGLHGSSVLVTATVSGRHPVGVITFVAGDVRTAVPITSSRHSALLVITRGVAVSARYPGDATNQPSTARRKT
jgi:hypothetical protein